MCLADWLDGGVASNCSVIGHVVLIEPVIFEICTAEYLCALVCVFLCVCVCVKNTHAHTFLDDDVCFHHWSESSSESASLPSGEERPLVRLTLWTVWESPPVWAAQSCLIWTSKPPSAFLLSFLSGAHPPLTSDTRPMSLPIIKWVCSLWYECVLAASEADLPLGGVSLLGSWWMWKGVTLQHREEGSASYGPGESVASLEGLRVEGAEG